MLNSYHNFMSNNLLHSVLSYRKFSTDFVLKNQKQAQFQQDNGKFYKIREFFIRVFLEKVPKNAFWLKIKALTQLCRLLACFL